MHNIVLYCKSFKRDIELVKRLIESIDQYNRDNIVTYLSVPKHDMELFQSLNLNNVILIEDELVYEGNASGWMQQQIVKSSFYKLKLAKNWVCLDSDAFFIKPFYITDFIYEDDIPYTVMHEQKELFTWTAINSNILGFDPKESFNSDRKQIMDVFDRKGRIYDFGPAPIIWSSKVWLDLENNYMIPNNLTMQQLIEFCASEFTWYGEALLRFKSIPIYPAEPLFKVFHYKQQLEEFNKLNITAECISKNYLGIIVQSNIN
jgi:hypothetical protein